MAKVTIHGTQVYTGSGTAVAHVPTPHLFNPATHICVWCGQTYLRVMTRSPGDPSMQWCQGPAGSWPLPGTTTGYPTGATAQQQIEDAKTLSSKPPTPKDPEPKKEAIDWDAHKRFMKGLDRT